MRLLLDTNAFLWFADGSQQLSQPAKEQIENTGHEVYLSVASIWEMAIKISLGKLEIALPVDEFIKRQLELGGIELLAVSEHHACAVAKLPFHHRDPFDRMLAAQCLADGLAIVSPDTCFERYGVQRLW